MAASADLSRIIGAQTRTAAHLRYLSATLSLYMYAHRLCPLSLSIIWCLVYMYYSFLLDLFVLRRALFPLSPQCRFVVFSAFLYHRCLSLSVYHDSSIV